MIYDSLLEPETGQASFAGWHPRPEAGSKDVGGEPPEPARPGRAQLSLTQHQDELPPRCGRARQLALLDEPPLWEIESSAPARRRTPRGRSRRTRSPLPLSPGQMSLF